MNNPRSLPANRKSPSQGHWGTSRFLPQRRLHSPLPTPWRPIHDSKDRDPSMGFVCTRHCLQDAPPTLDVLAQVWRPATPAVPRKRALSRPSLVARDSPTSPVHFRHSKRTLAPILLRAADPDLAQGVSRKSPSPCSLPQARNSSPQAQTLHPQVERPSGCG